MTPPPTLFRSSSLSEIALDSIPKYSIVVQIILAPSQSLTLKYKEY